MSVANLQPWGKSGPSQPGPSAEIRSNGFATVTMLPVERYQYADNRITWPSAVPSSGGVARQASRYWADRDADADMLLPCNGFIGCRNNSLNPQAINCVFDGLPQCPRFQNINRADLAASATANTAYAREWQRRFYGKVYKRHGRFNVARSRNQVVLKTTAPVVYLKN